MPVPLISMSTQENINSPWPGAKWKKIVGKAHKQTSSRICRQIGLSLSCIVNTTLTSTIDIRQMCRQAKYWRGAAPPHPTPQWLSPWPRARSQGNDCVPYHVVLIHVIGEPFEDGYARMDTVHVDGTIRHRFRMAYVWLYPRAFYNRKKHCRWNCMIGRGGGEVARTIESGQMCSVTSFLEGGFSTWVRYSTNLSVIVMSCFERAFANLQAKLASKFTSKRTNAKEARIALYFSSPIRVH